MGSSRDSVWRSEAEESVTVPVPSTASIARTRSVPSEAGWSHRIAGVVSRRLGYRSAIVLVFLLLVFVLIQCLLPLRSAIKIGADEGFELAKATLCLNGYKLYTDIWNDQPPLDTFLITQVLRHLSPSVLGPRLLTIAFSSVLLVAVFVAGLRINALLTAALSTVWLIAAPGFVELTSSVMQEIPALAPAVAALSVLLICRQTPCPFAEILAGILFAIALQMKFIGVVYLPMGALLLWLRHREAAPALARPLGSPTASQCESREVKGGSALGACLEIPVCWPAFRLPGSRSTLKHGHQTVSSDEHH